MPVQVPLDTVGGLVCCARPEDLPEGASPRTYDTDFMIGRWYQRPGCSSVYTFADSAVGPNGGAAAANATVTGSAWANPSNVLVDDGNYAVAGSLLAGSDALDVTEFAFDEPSTSTGTGIQVALTAFASTATDVTVQLLQGGVPIGVAKTVPLPAGASVLTLGGGTDLWGAAPRVNDTTFGVRITVVSGFALATAYVGYVSVTLFVAEESANFNYLKTFEADDGTVINLAIDANGDWWKEDVTNNPGVLTLVMEGLTRGSYASSCTAQDGEFFAFSNLSTGSDLPRKFTIEPQTTDRVSQVGPGASPVFAAAQDSTTTYPIVSITQPAQMNWTFAFGLQSTGPGQSTPGNVVTQYYADSTLTGPDAALVAAFNSGNPVYLYVQCTPSSGGDTVGALATPLTVLVTSIGQAKPNGQSRLFYYFTYQVPDVAFVWNPGQLGYGVRYQQSLATLTTSVPVPGVTVGGNLVVTGVTPTNWNNTWPVSQTLNSGSMQITQTSLSNTGVGTYSYNVVSGANPTAGQQVTVSNTLNANGALNVVNATIAAVTGTSIGTFTINLLPAGTTFPPVAEDGQATTSGTEFAFDPGVTTLGTATSPIYGNGSGGDITVTGSGQFIGPGTRQGVCFFITRNGFETAPSPPVTFDCPSNTTAISATQIPLGPPNVIARGIAFTEAGANGIPGANFFTIPDPVQYIVNNVTYTASSLIIRDNVTTSAVFHFPDATLQEATAIDVQGNDLFNLIELPDPAWVLKFASRNVYGLTRNKLQNFLNLSFDGGYLPGVQLTALGWSTPDLYGQLLVSPIFGNSYYIKNSTDATLGTAGLIAQSAYQDAFLVPILRPNVTYSLRVCARIPSGLTAGSLVVDLVANGISYGSYTLPFAQMADSFAIFEGELLTNALATVPSALQLRVYASGLGAGADLEIDRLEIYPTLAPVNQTDPLVSYVNNLESIDANTGAISTAGENSQPCFGGAVVLDELYLLKERSMYSTQDSANFEPNKWGVREVGQAVGTCGQNAFDYGDEWLLTMGQSGGYGFNGGRPECVTRELQLQNGPTPAQKKGLWESINWNVARTFWLRNDIVNRRFYCGVALPTPNYWLPNAPESNPTQPNVILMCNYEGCATFDELVTAAPVHTTIMGALKALEQKRKWSIWQIPCPYAAMVKRTTGEALTLLLCNGIASGKIYELVPKQTNDDGVPIYPVYTSYGFDGNKQSTAAPMGPGIKTMTWWSGNVQGNGLGGLRFIPNTLSATKPQKNPLALRLQDLPDFNDERKCEISGQRIFVEISGQGGYIECGSMAVDMAPNPWGTKRGIALRG
jgi:hypothetical protein